MQLTQQPTPLPFWALKRPDLISLKAPEPMTCRGRVVSPTHLRKMHRGKKRAAEMRSKQSRALLLAILRAVSKYYSITVEGIKGPRRTESVAWARLMFLATARDMVPISDRGIARVVNRDGRLTFYAALEVSARANPREIEDVRKLIRKELAA